MAYINSKRCIGHCKDSCIMMVRVPNTQLLTSSLTSIVDEEFFLIVYNIFFIKIQI